METSSLLSTQLESVIDRTRSSMQHESLTNEFIEITEERAVARLSGRCAGYPCAKVDIQLAVRHEAPEIGSCGLSLDGRLREIERGLVRSALAVSSGNKSQAARLLRLKRSTFADRLRKLGL